MIIPIFGGSFTWFRWLKWVCNLLFVIRTDYILINTYILTQSIPVPVLSSIVKHYLASTSWYRRRGKTKSTGSVESGAQPARKFGAGSSALGNLQSAQYYC